MDFRDSPSEAAFRSELRAWIEDNLPDGWTSRPRGPRYVAVEVRREWSRRLYDAGYAGLTWPREFGGAGAPYSHQAIFLEESVRAETPEHIGFPIALGMAGPTIIAHGTPEQKQRFLDPMLRGDEIWCQGFSEPGSGSDLASLSTRAERDGDSFVVNGQKVWSSYAHIADWCILVTRTDPKAAKHAGLTYFVVDMASPGVEVRPLRQITGDPEFNEIFFSDVRVPADNVVGDVNGGWNVAMTTLLHERGTLGFALMSRLELAVKALVELAREQPRNGGTAAADPLVRDEIARYWIELQALRFTNYRALGQLVKTGVPGPEGSISKLRWSETNQSLTKTAFAILAEAALLDGEDAPWNGYWQYEQLRSRGNTIEAGTSEILRNIIAERVLGLPKSR